VEKLKENSCRRSNGYIAGGVRCIKKVRDTGGSSDHVNWGRD